MYLSIRTTYKIYAADGTKISSSNEFEIPEKTGDYVCLAEGVFGTKKAYDAYQFLFRFTVE